MKGEKIVAAECQGNRESAMEEKYQCRGEIVFEKDYYYADLKTNLKYPSLPCICLKIPEKKNLVLSLYEIGVYCDHITR